VALVPETGEVLGNDPNSFGVLRVLRGRDCSLIETIGDQTTPLRQSAGPALGDLDGDHNIDIVARLNTGGVVAFRWNGTSYVKYWTGAAAGGDISANQVWDGPSIHDLDNDGKPEIIYGATVYRADGCIASATLGFPAYNCALLNAQTRTF